MTNPQNNLVLTFSFVISPLYSWRWQKYQHLFHLSLICDNINVVLLRNTNVQRQCPQLKIIQYEIKKRQRSHKFRTINTSRRNVRKQEHTACKQCRRWISDTHLKNEKQKINNRTRNFKNSRLDMSARTGNNITYIKAYVIQYPLLDVYVFMFTLTFVYVFDVNTVMYVPWWMFI